eukprot:sb/3463408/
MLRISLLIPLLSIACVADAASSDKFWAIAHMANTEGALGWSLAAGANALEIDVRFDSAGEAKTTYHGTPCDCSCFIGYGMCMFPISEICTRTRPITAILAYLMRHELKDQVAMVYLDSKIDAVTTDKHEHAAGNMVKLIKEDLVGAGYKGYILVGGPNSLYLNEVSKQAKVEGLEDKIMITFDMYSQFSEQIEFLAKLDHPRTVISAGITACLQAFRNFEREAVLGRVNKARGVVSETIIWTIDTVRDWDTYYEAGARGMITNAVPELVTWVRERGYELYTLEDIISVTDPSATPLYSAGYCSCELEGGDGCKISKPAPSLSACQCSISTYNNATTCRGKVVGCFDNTSPQCLTPDSTYESCALGSGQCTGYTGRSTCTCEYNGSGCTVTTGPEGAGEACRCDRDSKGVCEGEVVRCADPSSPDCSPLSTTLLSCLQGVGDCTGYDENCECGKEGDGCKITSPSPNSTACHCRRYTNGQCRGHSTLCPSTPQSCATPDTSLSSCLLGGGNCSGYGNECECEYHGSGCRVKKPAPKGSACRCRTESSWFKTYCYGDVLLDLNPFFCIYKVYKLGK